jgi:hypothetical protein
MRKQRLGLITELAAQSIGRGLERKVRMHAADWTALGAVAWPSIRQRRLLGIAFAYQVIEHEDLEGAGRLGILRLRKRR